MKVTVNGKTYEARLAATEEEREKGLQGVKELPKDEGMLFMYQEPCTVGFWMDKTEVPLDIVFIDDDEEVISVYEGKPGDRTVVEEDDVKYVLEVNAKSGIRKGDDVDIWEDEKMMVLGPDGIPQMELQGGERIVSRRQTRILVRKARKAHESKEDKDYKTLGRYMFKVLEQQDNRKPEYVESPDG